MRQWAWREFVLHAPCSMLRTLSLDIFNIELYRALTPEHI